MPRIRLSEHEINFEEAAFTWYDTDLLKELEKTLMGLPKEPDDKEVIYIISRMWLAQLMAEYNVEDYDATIYWLCEQRADR